MGRVIVACGSQIGADAGAEMADAGGNAVDAAIAAAIVSVCTEPGIVAPGASGFVTIWPESGTPVVLDAYAEMPGRGLTADRFGGGGTEISMGYGGGTTTIVGFGSVATPGAFAGLGKASREYGVLSWSDVLQPAIRWAEAGFPLPKASADYMAFSAEPIFGWHPESRRAVIGGGWTSMAVGDRVWIPNLADSLRMIAEEGWECLYTGTLGQTMAEDMEANGGLVTLEDLAAYEAIEREPVRIDVDDWLVVTNPPPAVGGAAMAAMLLLLRARGFSGWDGTGAELMVRIQRAVFDYRRARFDGVAEVAPAVEELLDGARLGDYRALLSSPSTTHISAVDSDGTGCAITLSAGYGSGAMISGTGIWLNNSLGEIELHPEGFHALTPGTRLSSNMAPSLARRADGAILAIGSPGADRITSALAQVLVNFLHLGMSLDDAIAHPRLHVEVFEGAPTIAHEPGLSVTAIDDLVERGFPEISMYFGGVQAAYWDPGSGFVAAADPRRTGGVAEGGG